MRDSGGLKQLASGVVCSVKPMQIEVALDADTEVEASKFVLTKLANDVTYKRLST